MRKKGKAYQVGEDKERGDEWKSREGIERRERECGGKGRLGEHNPRGIQVEGTT